MWHWSYTAYTFPQCFVLQQDISVTSDKCYKTKQIAVDNHHLGRVAV